MKRRTWLATTAAWVAAAPTLAMPTSPWRKPIPAGGERLPVVGMGTWLTFDVDDDAPAREPQRRVLQRFLAAGGGMIDSSPMYGRAERVIGDLLAALGVPPADGRVFAASKIWTPLGAGGPAQLADSLRLWRRPRMDLMQVHNLLATAPHLATLRAAREDGRVRYVGITTSHGRRHDEVERLLKAEPLDFLQITYNPADRSAERVIELAADRGVAVIVNRPFDGGAALQRLAGRPLPAWVGPELGIATWAALVLAWEVSHPGVTCAIPATTDPAHMDENMATLRVPPPTPAQRRRLAQALAEA